MKFACPATGNRPKPMTAACAWVMPLSTSGWSAASKAVVLLALLRFTEAMIFCVARRDDALGRARVVAAAADELGWRRLAVVVGACSGGDVVVVVG